MRLVPLILPDEKEIRTAISIGSSRSDRSKQRKGTKVEKNGQGDGGKKKKTGK